MAGSRVDLHLHSTASDGAAAPADVIRAAVAAQLGHIALTDHDTLAGVPAARAAGEAVGVRVIAGCEFSVDGPGGEMHLLGYFLPESDADLDAFLTDQRAKRRARGDAIVERLQALGVPVTREDVQQVAGDAAVGRPHLARAVVARGAARDINDAFDRFLGAGRPAFVPKDLPSVGAVTGLVRSLGGVTSVAHLKDRGVRPILQQLQKLGVDGVEALHPSHSPDVAGRIRGLADQLGLLPTGGSDWHGDFAVHRAMASLGSQDVPAAWLERLEQVHRERTGVEVH